MTEIMVSGKGLFFDAVAMKVVAEQSGTDLTKFAEGSLHVLEAMRFKYERGDSDHKPTEAEFKAAAGVLGIKLPDQPQN